MNLRNVLFFAASAVAATFFGVALGALSLSPTAAPAADADPSGSERQRARATLSEGHVVRNTPVFEASEADPSTAAVGEPGFPVRAFDERISRFEEEDRDDDWANATESEIWSALQSDSLGVPTVENYECKSTMCMVELAYADDASLELFEDNLSSTPPFNTHGMIREGSAGPLTKRVLFSRVGEILPKVEEPVAEVEEL